MRSSIWRRLRTMVLLVCIACAASSRAAQVRLAWDPPTNNTDGTVLTDLAGYKLLRGTASGVYTVVTNVGNVTTSLVSNLTEGQTYYFVTRAYNAVLEESDNSQELVCQAPDTTPPIITPPANLTLPAGSTGTTAIPNLVAGTVVTDNVSSAASIVVTQAPVAGTMVGLGVTAVTVTARDQANNTTQAIVQVTVVDQTAPVITAPSPVTVTAGTNDMAATPDFLASLAVSDNCTPQASLVLAQTPAAGTQVAVGTTTVTIAATDAAGNRAETTVNVTVLKANRAPIVDAGDGITFRVNQSGSLEGLATDDALPAGSSVSVTWTKVSGPGTVTFGAPNALSTSVSMSVEGGYVLRLTATDGALSASDDVTVTVLPKAVPDTPVNLRVVAP